MVKINQKCLKSRQILRITQNAENPQIEIEIRAEMARRYANKLSRVKNEVKWSKSTKSTPTSSKSSSNPPKSRQKRPKVLQNPQNVAQMLQNHVKAPGFQQNASPPLGPACLPNPSKSLQIPQNLSKSLKIAANPSKSLQVPQNRCKSIKI